MQARCVSRNFTSITALLHYCLTASQHHCITASLHYSITASLHHSITALQHHCITASLHYSITASQHHCIPRLIIFSLSSCISVKITNCAILLLLEIIRKEYTDKSPHLNGVCSKALKRAGNIILNSFFREVA